MTLQMSFLYAVGFGGFVAFSVYLPTYLKDGVRADARRRRAAHGRVRRPRRRSCGRSAAGCPTGSHPVPVLVGCFAVVAVFAAVSALERPLAPIGHRRVPRRWRPRLGAASGAVFALVALVAPAGKVGAVTGIVGAAGGLGGFVPPLIMGAVYGWQGNYKPGSVRCWPSRRWSPRSTPPGRCASVGRPPRR